MYIDSNELELNSTVAGQIPRGQKIAAGETFQYQGWPLSGVIYIRAAVESTIEVTP